MDQKTYTVATSGYRISEFLDMVIGDMGLEFSFEILEGQHLHPDLEDPDLLVKFSGPDVDILLANKAELLLALEFLTMEALKMPGEHHSLLCFDSNDYRTLRIEELRLSARDCRGEREEDAQAVPLQSDEQPRAAHYSPEPAQRNRHPQREHRQRTFSPGGGSADRHAAARADSSSAARSATAGRPA